MSKHVKAHDDVCERVLQSSQSTPRSKSSLALQRSEDSDVTTSDEEACVVADADDAQDCPICFESIEVGDVVSWAPQTNCGHVFHHGCIKEWLLRNDSCPFCRKICLPIDGVLYDKKKQIVELLRAQQIRSTPCYYCDQHGVVRPSNHLLSPSLYGGASPSGEDRNFYNALQQRALQLCDRNELQRLRGNIHVDRISPPKEVNPCDDDSVNLDSGS